MVRPTDMSYAKIDAPCFFVNPGDALPPKLKEVLDGAWAAEILEDDGFQLIRVELPDREPVFSIFDELSGERFMARVSDASEKDFLARKWTEHKGAEALELFVGACSSGGNHFDSWEEHSSELNTQLSEEEFHALYSGDLGTLVKILDETT